MFIEKENIVRTLATASETCFPEQDSPESRAVTQRSRLPHSGSRASSRSIPIASFHHETQLSAAVRELQSSFVAQPETAVVTTAQRAGRSCPTFEHRELVLLSSRGGVSRRCDWPSTSQPSGQPVGLEEPLTNDFSAFRPQVETSGSARPPLAGWRERSIRGRVMPCCRNRDNRVMIPQPPRNPGTTLYRESAKSAKRKFARPTSENPQSAVATGRVLGPAHSRRDPCSEIKPRRCSIHRPARCPVLRVKFSNRFERSASRTSPVRSSSAESVGHRILR